MTELTEVTNASHKAIKAAYCELINDVIDRLDSKPQSVPEAQQRLHALHEEIILLMARRNALRRECAELEARAESIRADIDDLTQEAAIVYRAANPGKVNEVPRRMVSDRQAQIFEFVRDYIAVNSYGPTIREITRELGISSTSVTVYNLEGLQEVGLLRREKYTQRAIEITGRLV